MTASSGLPWALIALVATAVAAAAALPPRRSLARDLPTVPSGASRVPGPAPPSTREGPWLRVTVTLAVGLGAVVLVGGWPGSAAGVVAAVVCWALTGRMEPAAVRRRREALTAAVPHVVDLMAACLSAGLAPAAALEQIADAVEPPMREELLAVSARLRLGVDPTTAWRDLARHPQLGGVGRSLARATDSGASVADAMLRLAEDLRQRSRAQVEARARAVGVKAAVPLGVCLLPAFILVGVVPLVAGSLSALTR